MSFIFFFRYFYIRIVRSEVSLLDYTKGWPHNRIPIEFIFIDFWISEMNEMWYKSDMKRLSGSQANV